MGPVFQRSGSDGLKGLASRGLSQVLIWVAWQAWITLSPAVVFRPGTTRCWQRSEFTAVEGSWVHQCHYFWTDWTWRSQALWQSGPTQWLGWEIPLTSCAACCYPFVQTRSSRKHVSSPPGVEPAALRLSSCGKPELAPKTWGESTPGAHRAQRPVSPGPWRPQEEEGMQAGSCCCPKRLPQPAGHRAMGVREVWSQKWQDRAEERLGPVTVWYQRSGFTSFLLVAIGSEAF